jgi:hypothetical protein
MDRCIVSGNEVGGVGLGFGGGGVFETNSIIRSSLIVSNRMFNINTEPATYGALGGGVYMQGGALLNCTVSRNSADKRSGFASEGGGVFAESGGLTNCIIYFNLLTDTNRASTNWFNLGPAIFDHCCTAPDPGGAGNITQDPQFNDMTNGNFHLASSSPCIGAGVIQLWMSDAQDLDGNPRTSGRSLDLGPYQTPAVATPQDRAQALITEVNSLIAAGSLRHGNGNALLASLRAAFNSINRGQAQASCGQTAAFIQKVRAFANRRQLNESEGQALISAANDLRAALGCSGQ